MSDSIKVDGNRQAPHTVNDSWRVKQQLQQDDMVIISCASELVNKIRQTGHAWWSTYACAQTGRHARPVAESLTEHDGVASSACQLLASWNK